MSSRSLKSPIRMVEGSPRHPTADVRGFALVSTLTLMAIADTYTPKRDQMFRRWLLSLPEGMEKNINAPMTPNAWDDSNSVVLVGEGSAGSSVTEIRAYLSAVTAASRGVLASVRTDRASQKRSQPALRKSQSHLARFPPLRSGRHP